MAKQCGSCGFRMGTFQEVSTFTGNVLISAAASGALAFAVRRIAPSFANFGSGAANGTVGATAGFDNTVFRGRTPCPKCGESGRWMDC